jgi:hypothetical protein
MFTKSALVRRSGFSVPMFLLCRRRLSLSLEAPDGQMLDVGVGNACGWIGPALRGSKAVEWASNAAKQ